MAFSHLYNPFNSSGFEIICTNLDVYHVVVLGAKKDTTLIEQSENSKKKKKNWFTFNFVFLHFSFLSFLLEFCPN